MLFSVGIELFKEQISWLVIDIFLFIIVIALLGVHMFTRKFLCTNKWKGYIENAIKEVEKEMEKKGN